jgi:hypothetical protein
VAKTSLSNPKRKFSREGAKALSLKSRRKILFLCELCPLREKIRAQREF